MSLTGTAGSSPPSAARWGGTEALFRAFAVPAGLVLVLAVLVGSQVALEAFLGLIEAALIVFFLRHLGLAVAALRTAPADLAAPLAEQTDLPTVTMMVACKNEQAVAETLVARLVEMDYPAELRQLILIDDGSTDATPQLLAELADRHPSLTVLTRQPGAGGGKSGALNAGLAVATGEIVVVFDADHQPRRDVVRRLVRHFVDPRVAAAQGRCEIRNPGDSPLARLVALDYLAGYLVDEYSRQSLFELPAYGGANCAVRASALRELGGWNPHTVTEDTDLTLRLLLSGRRIRYDVTAVDEEEGVIDLRRFWRQRYRWARGHQQVWRDYRSAVWRSRRLSLREKVETTAFLLTFHLPVLTGLGAIVLVLWLAGVVHPTLPIDLSYMWMLMFLGPLLELGAGLLIGQAPRRWAWSLLFFQPLFFVSMALCTKAWVDGLLERPYSWVKTQRARDVSQLGVSHG